MPMTSDRYDNDGGRRPYPVSAGYRRVLQEQAQLAGEHHTPLTESRGMSSGAEVSGYGIASGAGWWPLLADDMFRVIHEDRDGGRLLHPDVAALGLAAALLGELLLAGRVTFRAGQVIVLDLRPPLDALAHTVLDQSVGRRWLTRSGCG